MPDETPETPDQPAQLPAGNTPLFAANEKLAKVNVADEMKNSFLDYSMSVIISRTLPDVRDGLKPSQRRILYGMHDLSLFPNRQHRKCAKICGDTSGNYHPHGEAVIYPTLVHMAQPWAMRERLVDGQGNFGSVEGDPPAAMRYTEARMTHLGAALMQDMDKDTVDFVPNYDETLTEPTVFPAAFPNLLVNGGTGIAVGMATNMAPHNLGEIVDGICAQIDNPAITLAQLMKHVKGPDFPTGCMLCGMEPIKQYFETGRGSLKVRGKVGVEQVRGGREQIIITEIPYNVNRALLVERIAELVNDKTIPDITAIRDESDENTRVVIELKRDAIAKVVINNLYQFTALESSFAVNSLAIDHGRPKTLGLKALITAYIEHRREVVIRRTRFELRKAEAEYLEWIGKIKDLLDILAREPRVLAIIKTELLEIKDKYATPRLTELVPDEGEIAIEDLIANEGVIITITHSGLIKRTNSSSYRAQRRGGRGVIGMTTREGSSPGGEKEDFIEHLFTAITNDFLLFFTST